MALLYEELGLHDKRLQQIVSRTATDVMMHQHFGYGDISTLPEIERQILNNDFKQGLMFLQENSIIKFSEETYLYRVTVLNEYRLNQLVGELGWLETYLDGVSAKTPPPNEDMAFYERSSGNIIINGTSKTLKGTNKKLFDALFIASPEHASRSVLLRIIGEKRRESSTEKIALNEAFSNLRKACGVTSRTISLGQNGGKLNARVAHLIESDEIYLSNFLTA
jgi:hypothetical protein